MSVWNRFFTKAKETAVKVSDKAEELVETVTDSVKIKALELRVDRKYEELGRLVYTDLHTDEDLEEEKLQVIAAIDALFDQIAVLKEKDGEEAEEAEEAAPEAEAEAPAEEQGAPTADAE